ncbi:MAG: GxxExxY protein [Candidatus Doudnabacteria bacterium]|nr:GxxExxY protein [Candidatus Doudnabacteria bacterium]
MNTNYTNKLIHPELSYTLTGICFTVHNNLGRFSREKQYADAVEGLLKQSKIPYKREFRVTDTGNIIDFLIDDKIVLEIKSKRLILKTDFYQTQRYLQSSNKDLALLVNFQNRYLKPIRIVRIETDARKKFI